MKGGFRTNVQEQHINAMEERWKMEKKGRVINPSDRVVVSKATLESGCTLFYVDKTINGILGRIPK